MTSHTHGKQSNVLANDFPHNLNRRSADRAWILLIFCVIATMFSALSSVAGAAPPELPFSLEFETGAVWQSRNQIQIPDSSAGTRFALTDIQGHGPEAQRRVEIGGGMAGMGGGNFYAEPLPDVHMRFPNPLWHLVKFLHQKVWLSRQL